MGSVDSLRVQIQIHQKLNGTVEIGKCVASFSTQVFWWSVGFDHGQVGNQSGRLGLEDDPNEGGQHIIGRRNFATLRFYQSRIDAVVGFKDALQFFVRRIICLHSQQI